MDGRNLPLETGRELTTEVFGDPDRRLASLDHELSISREVNVCSNARNIERGNPGRRPVNTSVLTS
jgi:hypothetical protein